MEEKIILLTHGDWGKALKSSVEMILGKADFVSAVALTPEMLLAEFRQAVEAAILAEVKKAQEKHVSLHITLMTDVFGGTPTNVAAVIAKEREDCTISVITGLNCPLLIEACTQISFGGELDIKKVLASCQSSIFDVMEKITGK